MLFCREMLENIVYALCAEKMKHLRTKPSPQFIPPRTTPTLLIIMILHWQFRWTACQWWNNVRLSQELFAEFLLAKRPPETSASDNDDNGDGDGDGDNDGDGDGGGD